MKAREKGTRIESEGKATMRGSILRWCQAAEEEHTTGLEGRVQTLTLETFTETDPSLSRFENKTPLKKEKKR